MRRGALLASLAILLALSALHVRPMAAAFFDIRPDADDAHITGNANGSHTIKFTDCCQLITANALGMHVEPPLLLPACFFSAGRANELGFSKATFSA